MRNTGENEGVAKALLAQLNRLAQHNRQGSYQTRQRYYEAMQRFCRYLAEEYHLQKLSNISGKHVAAYAEYLQESGKSASTIKTDLAAIRFFHDKRRAMENRYRSLDELPLALRVEELMPILGIGRNTAYELVRSRQIRSIKIGRQIRVPRDAVAEYLRGQ